MHDGKERRFSREETALILRRATDGERRPAELDSGLTLGEIEAAAREAGIDPAAVRRAAALRIVPADTRLVGAPVSLEIRARFDGHLPEDGHGALQSAVEHVLGRRGSLECVGDQVTWHEDHGFGRTTVSARPDGDGVAVSAEADRRGHLLLLVLGVATAVALLLQPLGGFGGLAALGGALAAVLAPLAVIALGTRAAWPLLQRPVARRLEQVALAVGGLLEPAAPRTLPTTGTADR